MVYLIICRRVCVDDRRMILITLIRVRNGGYYGLVIIAVRAGGPTLFGPTRCSSRSEPAEE